MLKHWLNRFKKTEHLIFNFDQFYIGLINKTDIYDGYLDKYPSGEEKKFKIEILTLLKEHMERRNIDGLKKTLVLACLDGVDTDYTDIIVNLLAKKWHFDDENLAELLWGIKDPKSVDCLYETALEISEDDEFRSKAQKCIWGLGAINTNDSKEKLLILASCEDDKIKEYALNELNTRK